MQHDQTKTSVQSAMAAGQGAGLDNKASAMRATLTFGGRAGEYFGIWIVNILLSILTLGIYSAWAKVRNRRYFYGHTELVGHAFDYLASPIAILKGRLIAFFILVLYIGVDYLVPGLGLLFILAIWLAYRFTAVRRTTH